MKSVQDISVARVIARLNVGGPAIQAILMTDAMRRKGYRAVLLTGEVSPGEASMEYLADANDVSPIRIKGLARRISLRRDLAAIWKVRRVLREQKTTVVHTHTAKAGTVGRIAAILAGTPVRVHTFHGHVFSGYFSPLVTRVFLAVERYLARHTDCIVAISESQRRELVEIYKVAPANKVITIPLGFDLEPFLCLREKNGFLREAVAGAPGQPLIGWVGRLTAIKSPASIIECALLMKKRNSKARFVLVGDGDLRQDCETRIQDGELQDTVRLLGWRRDLPMIYAGLDFVVGTSLSEGTPVALLEAMASAKAIISTDVGGVRDLMAGPVEQVDGLEVFKNGILVDCNVARLDQAIQFLIERPHLARRMGEEGRQLVIKRRFTQARLADDLAELYQSLAKRKVTEKGGVSGRPKDVEPSRFATDKAAI